MKYRNYKIILGRNLTDLEQKVNNEFQLGYTPIGGVLISGSTYAQAVARVHD